MGMLDVSFDVPTQIAAGLANQTLVRNGGVIQDNAGRVVMWLKEASDGTGLTPAIGTQAISAIDPTGALRLAFTAGDSIVTHQKLGAISGQLSQVQGMLMLNTAGSLLTLGVSALGFALIYQKVKSLEGRLKEVQETLDEIDEKIDLSFYANFRAALDLAQNAFLMNEENNRHNSALQAINRFLEAEHVYTDLTDKELEHKSQIGDEYLLTLCLAYLAETRCYLELGEYDTALRRFQEGKAQVRNRIEKYIDLLLTEKPLIYLHPRMKDQIDLSRLAKIYQWKDPSMNENALFEVLRDDLPDMGLQFNDWIEQVPISVIDKSKIKRGFFGGYSEENLEIIFARLPQVVEEAEFVIETNQRFASYEYEIKLLGKAKVPFRKWIDLRPSQALPEGVNLICVTPQKPLAL